MIFNMVGGGGGSLKNTDAVLIVSVPTGSTVTATKGGVTLTPTIWAQNADNTLDTAIFSVKASTFDSNAWTVTATLNGDTASDTVVIDSAEEYSLELNFRLPSLYQEVEYIASSGTQWIDTGITPNSNTLCKIKFMNLEVTGNTIFGYSSGNELRFFNNSSAYYFDLGSSRINGGTCYANTLQEIELGNYYVKNIATSATIISGSTLSFTGEKTITLNGSSNCSKNRWYYVQIYNGSDLVCNLIPCYRISDSVAGMWNNVSKTFLTNQGSGSFTVGADVT